MSNRNDPDLFPKLRLVTMRKHAERLAKFISHLGISLESITLHHADPIHWPKQHYLMLFRIREIKVPQEGEEVGTEWQLLSTAKSYLQNFLCQPKLFEGFEEVYSTPQDEPLFYDAFKSQPGLLQKEWVFVFNTEPGLHGDYYWIKDLSGEFFWELYAQNKSSENLCDIAKEVNEEAEFLYGAILQYLHDQDLDITTTARSSEVYEALIEVRPGLNLKHLGSIPVSRAYCTLKSSNPRKNFIEKMIQLVAEEKGQKISLSKAGELCRQVKTESPSK